MEATRAGVKPERPLVAGRPLPSSAFGPKSLCQSNMKRLDADIPFSCKCKTAPAALPAGAVRVKP